MHDWLGDPKTALTTIAIVNSWKGFGWGFIILLAGLQTIDKQLYEAAKIDGAGAWKTFTNVTIPMMLPVILVVVILDDLRMHAGLCFDPRPWSMKGWSTTRMCR